MASPVSSTRRRFDDRSLSRTALVRRARKSPDVLSATQSPHGSPAPESVFWPDQHIIHWTPAGGVEATLRSARFSAHFGNPCCLHLSPSYILIGLSHGGVACFNYHQKLSHIFEQTTDFGADSASAEISCISVSCDGRLAAGGTSDGRVVIWEFPAPNSAQTVRPYHVIVPSSTSETNRPDSGSSARQTVAFLGDSYDLVSSDHHAVYFHHGFTKLFKLYYSTEKVHECGINSKVSHSEHVCPAILDCQLLPLGTKAQITDQIGLVAVITRCCLTVFSVRSLNNLGSVYPKVHVQVSRARNVESCVGFLAWYPCIKTFSTARLAYSWGNEVCMLEVDFSALPENVMQVLANLKDKDRGIPSLPHLETACIRFPGTSCVQALKWSNSEVLSAVVADSAGVSEMCFLHGPELSVVARERFPFVESRPSLQRRFQVFRHRPLLLEPPVLYTGKTLKWADQLISLLSENLFADAFWCAYQYYSSNDKGKLLLHGLPHTLKERQQVVEPFLIRIMHEAAETLSAADSGRNSTDISSFLRVISEIAENRGGVLGADLLELIELLQEKCHDKAKFFDALSELILLRKIANLSPSTFESLVQYSVENGYGERLTEVVCLLDISTLNIDTTLKLCRKHHLRECSVYIWNCVFHDFLTPLEELSKGLCVQEYDYDQRNLVYAYMSYILSGRRFPTDDFLEDGLESLGRESITSVLFSSEKTEKCSISGLDGSPFPYLGFFLKQNSFEMLATLNEFFENPVLNSDRKNLNRQYFMDAVLDTFSASEFEPGDYVQLSVFVARNYPKYHQFIRISDSTVQDTVGNLLRGNGQESQADRELALECILPFYSVPNQGFLLEHMKAAGFFHAAFRVYVQERRFSSALDVWMQSQDASEIDFSIVADLLTTTFSSGTAAEQSRVLTILDKNCHYFFGNFPREMASLGKLCPKIHLLALGCSDSEAFEYLKLLEDDDFTEKLASAFIRLSCIHNSDSVAEMVERFAARSVLGDTQAVLGDLRHFEQFEAMAVVYVQDGQYGEAVTAIISSIESSGTAVEAGVNRGIVICKNHPEHWAFFIESLVLSSQKLDHGIYRCFRAIIDSEGHTSSPLFNDVLSSIMEKAQVSNVREILQEVLMSFYFESETNIITLSKINDEIRKSMEIQRRDVLRGWLIRNKTCASCGKGVWGPDMSDGSVETNEMALEERTGARAVGESFDMVPYAVCQLQFFRCSHVYHVTCLQGLREDKCVLCTQGENPCTAD